ncbi:MAG: aldo/keto reductase [Tissierellia bacterium]|nr:aldo/keto reductase [Tissierellia bacterium]
MAFLGKTGIEVSKLCFGSLTLSKFQADLPLSKGAELIVHAHRRGINFIDTAEIYDNYAFFKEAFKTLNRDQMVVATKAYCYDEKTADESLNKALKEMGTDYIDIFLLHEQESLLTLKGHREALKTLVKRKEEGYIRAVGISTHFVQCVAATQLFEEIEVIHPILNMAGIGIQDGSLEDMIEILKRRHQQGIGIYSMKALGGGHLISRAQEALDWVLNLDFIDSTAVGMQSVEEVDANASRFLEGKVAPAAEEKIAKKERKLIVADYCVGCGNCQRRCKQNAIEVVDGRATPNENCILCGYCATVCPEFCIKVI